jgi:integrase
MLLKTLLKCREMKESPYSIDPFRYENGTVSYRLSGMRPGENGAKQIRWNFKTMAEAVAEKQILDAEIHNLPAPLPMVQTRLSEEQLAEAESAFQSLNGKSLTLAVKHFLDTYREPVTPKDLGEAYTEFLEDRKKANLRPLSIANLRIKVNFLVKAHAGKKAHEILPQQIKDVAFTKDRSPRAANNVRRALSGFFSWAVNQGYCKDNPVAKVKPAEEDELDPQILPIGDVRKLLAVASEFKEGKLLPYFALGLFCGIRPEETAKLNWDLIDLKQKLVRLPSTIAKMRAKRNVEISANCVQWLLPHSTKRTDLKPKNWRRDFDKIREICGYGTPSVEKPHLKPWVVDAMRHTAISHYYAKHQDEGRAASWAGNSPDVIHRHYKGLTDPKDTKAFWSISPSDAGKKILKLKAA